MRTHLTPTKLPESYTVPRKVAIDGLAASGKTTVGTMLANRWGIGFLDTGLMYRAVTLSALRENSSIDNPDRLGRIAELLHFGVTRRDDGSWGILIDAEDATEMLHSPSVNQYVSPVSAQPRVRYALVDQQRRIAEEGPIAMAGRDIGTVVLPDAQLKIFLIASDEARAQRRHREIIAKGGDTPYQAVLDNIRTRDEIDSSRQHSPLKPAQDAIIVSTDDQDAAATEQIIVDLYASKSK